MVKAAWNGADDADLVVLVIDAGAGITEEVRAIIDQLKTQNRKAILAMNKVDKVADKEKLLRLSQEFFAEEVFTDVFMISAKKGSGTQDLVNFLAAKMPDGPWMFPEDDVSDMPLRLLAAEITREKLYYQLQQELPYSATVETELWEERKDGSVKLEQTIFVEREGQKAIILGKGGKRIKALGSDARKELEAIFERRVHLFLFVKVRENWGDDPNRFAMWGLDPNA